jgi:hypothetical protein
LDYDFNGTKLPAGRCYGMKAFQKFQIELPVQVIHADETFEVRLPGRTLYLLNNGDNSWSQLKGDLPQELINTVGEAIEQYIRKNG